MFLLDTQLGKVWTLTKYTDIAGEPSVWKDMTIVDDGPDDTKIPGSVTIRQLIEIYPQKQESKAKK